LDALLRELLDHRP